MTETDYIKQLVGNICVVHLKDGRTFSSKLVDVSGSLLIFQSREGRIACDDLSEVLSVCQI